ncbi:hypothetical protein BG844_32340 [Couchioplanes caeruleus subsp. caeruleus]|uniref:Zinc-binding alcohol dehydrogenase family protein n=1 Tax=Couchioplanes caeruleus subsp. caeruleus TaxID=56427 RepID=A0A1K0FBY0_9ACTN|nr:hypothetical protein BG844_32340 [Couchioplanes caeruleus subsp. caeruleus]
MFSTHSAGMMATFAQIVKPFGAVVAIDNAPNLDVSPLMSKSIAWHWELMFTRALHDPTSTAQHEILRQAAELVDKGILHTTMTTLIERIDAAGLRRAHADVEAGSTIGKTVLAGF